MKIKKVETEFLDTGHKIILLGKIKKSEYLDFIEALLYENVITPKDLFHLIYEEPIFKEQYKQLKDFKL